MIILFVSGASSAILAGKKKGRYEPPLVENNYA